MKKYIILYGKRYKDVKRLQNGFITQIWTNVDIDEFVKKFGKTRKVYEGVICKENSKVSALKNVTELPINLKLKDNDEGNDFLVI